MATMLHRDLEAGERRSRRCCRATRSRVAGDSMLRFKGGEYVLTSYAGMSHRRRRAGRDRARAARQRALRAAARSRLRACTTRRARRMSGFKAGSSLQRQGGRHWIWTIQHDNESPNLELNDLGRLGTATASSSSATCATARRMPGTIFRSYWVGTRQTNEWNYGGDHVTRTAQVYANQVWRNFWTTQASYTLTRRRLDARLTRGGPLMEVPQGWTTQRPAAQPRLVANELEHADHRQRRRGRRVHAASSTASIAVAAGPAVAALDRAVVPARRSTRSSTSRRSPAAARDLRPALRLRRDRSQHLLDAVPPRPTRFKPDVTLDVYAEPFAASGSYYGHRRAGAPRARGCAATTARDGTTAATQGDGSLLVTDGARRVHGAEQRLQRPLVPQQRRAALGVSARQHDVPRLAAGSPHRRRRIGDRIGAGDPFRALGEPGNNYFVVKTSFWLPVSLSGAAFSNSPQTGAAPLDGPRASGRQCRA